MGKFNRHGVWNKSSFGLMNHLQINALKKILLPKMENAPTGEAYFALVGKLMAMRKTYHRIMTDNEIDVLLYPTTKVPNTPNDGGESFVAKGPFGKDLSEKQLGANMLFAPSQRTPSIAMFSGMDKAGLPLSVTFDGYTGQDRRLLDIAEALEKVLPPLAEPNAIGV